jgi:hypothetical protein
MFVDGKKAVRGDILDLDESLAASLGVRVEPVIEPPKKRGRPKKAKTDEG